MITQNEEGSLNSVFHQHGDILAKYIWRIPMQIINESSPFLTHPIHKLLSYIRAVNQTVSTDVTVSGVSEIV